MQQCDSDDCMYSRVVCCHTQQIDTVRRDWHALSSSPSLPFAPSPLVICSSPAACCVRRPHLPDEADGSSQQQRKKKEEWSRHILTKTTYHRPAPGVCPDRLTLRQRDERHCMPCSLFHWLGRLKGSEREHWTTARKRCFHAQTGQSIVELTTWCHEHASAIIARVVAHQTPVHAWHQANQLSQNMSIYIDHHYSSPSVIKSISINPFQQKKIDQVTVQYINKNIYFKMCKKVFLCLAHTKNILWITH